MLWVVLVCIQEVLVDVHDGVKAVKAKGRRDALGGIGDADWHCALEETWSEDLGRTGRSSALRDDG